MYSVWSPEFRSLHYLPEIKSTKKGMPKGVLFFVDLNSIIHLDNYLKEGYNRIKNIVSF